MTDIWSERAQAYRESRRAPPGPRPRPRRRLCEPTDGVTASRRRDRRRARRPAPARGGLEVVTVDPSPGHAARRRRRAPRTSRSPTRPSTSSPAAIAAHHFAGLRAAVRRDGPRQPRARARRQDNLFLGESGRGSRASCATRPTCATTPRSEWRGVLRGGGARGRERASSMTSASTSSHGSTGPGTPDEDGDRVRELLADRIEDGKLLDRARRSSCAEGSASRGDHRRQRDAARRPGHHRARRARSTPCATATTGRTSSPA